MPDQTEDTNKQLDLSLTPSVRDFVLASHNQTCQKCGKTADEAQLEIHHITPRANGGTNHPSNLTVYCRDCHQDHHSSRTTSGDAVATDGASVSLATRLNGAENASDIDPAPADRQIIAAVEAIGPATTGEIADNVDVTAEYVRRRLYALGSAKVVAKTEAGEWNLIEQVDNPVAGKLPDNPEQAARFARDDIMRRMKNAGMSHSEIADIVGLSERTVPTAINRARAFDPPLPPINRTDESDPEELHRQLTTLLQRVDALEARLGIETDDAHDAVPSP